MGSVNTYWGEGWRNGSATVNGRAGAAKGIAIIRFEMPYNVWCTSCSKMIGKGVRFNAEKNKAGKYYTTTLWSFKMKCHMCDGCIVVETDPKNDDYKMVEGVKKKAETWTAASTETIDLMDDAAKAKLASDPMFRLEHGEADKSKARVKKSSLARLLKAKSAVNDYDANSKLRGAFRVKRKELKAQHAADRALVAKASLHGSQVQLLPESAADKLLAAQMTFGGGSSGGRGGVLQLGGAAAGNDPVQQQKRAIQKGSIFDARGKVGSSSSSRKRAKLQSSSGRAIASSTTRGGATQNRRSTSSNAISRARSSSGSNKAGLEVFARGDGRRRGPAGLRAEGVGKGIDVSSFRLLKPGASDRSGRSGGASAVAQLKAAGLVIPKRGTGAVGSNGIRTTAAAAASSETTRRPANLLLVDDYSDDPD